VLYQEQENKNRRLFQWRGQTRHAEQDPDRLRHFLEGMISLFSFEEKTRLPGLERASLQ